jgi:hypothetical protein
MKLNFEFITTDEQETTLRRVWRKAVAAGESQDETAKLYGERIFLASLVENINASIESWSDLKGRKAALIDAIKAGDPAVITAMEAAINPQ